MKRSSSVWLGGFFGLAIVTVLAASTKNSKDIKIDPDPKGNFTLSVSNQSSAIPEVDISVEIDGCLAVSDSFSIGSGHNVVNYRFSLSRGNHTLTASTTKGQAQHEAKFEIEDRHWATITYWFHPEEENLGATESGSFHFEISDTPILFK